MLMYGLGTDGHRINSNNNLCTAANPTVRGIAQLDGLWVISVQVIFSNLQGAFVGVAKIEASNNYSPEGGQFGQPPNIYANANWVDVSAQFSPALTTAINANGSQMLTSPQGGCGWRAIAITLTYTSGTSIAFDCWVCGKGG